MLFHIFHVGTDISKSVQGRYSWMQLQDMHIDKESHTCLTHTLNANIKQSCYSYGPVRILAICYQFISQYAFRVHVYDMHLCVMETEKERARETEKMRPLSSSWTAHGYLCLSCFHLFSLIFCVCTSESSEDKHKHSIPTWHPSDRLSIKISKYQNVQGQLRL